MICVYRYPTGDTLIDDLTEFCAARLKATFGNYPKALNDAPCLAEDWWVADQMVRNISFPLLKLDRETAFRVCWRWARNRFPVGNDNAADLLLHQMAELLPTLFGHAKPIAKAKGGAA